MANSEDKAKLPTWTVTGQVERTVIDESGTPADVVQVTFRLPSGTMGTVNVPVGAYTVDNVRDAIAAKAQILAGVAALTGA